MRVTSLLSGVFLTSTLFSVASSSAAIIPITNGGFDTVSDVNGAAGDEKLIDGTVTGWSSGAGDTGVASGAGVGGTWGVYMQQNSSVEQSPIVNTIVVAAGTYTLTFFASRNGNNQPSTISVEFLTDAPAVAGGTPASFALPVLSNAPSTEYASYSSQWVVPSGSPLIGDFLGFRFINDDETYPWLDNVSLDFVALPEPSVAVLGVASAGLVLLRRRGV